MIARFLRNATFNLVAEISNRLANAVITILISRFLQVSNFGSYNIALSFFTIGSLLSFWGFGNLLIREVAKRPENFGKYFFNFGVIRIIFTSLSIVLIFLIASVFNYPPETLNVILIICLGIFAEVIKNLCYSAFTAFEKMQYVGIVYLISSLVKIIVSAELLIEKFGIIEVAWLNTIVNFASALVLIILTIKVLPSITPELDWSFIKKQTTVAFPLFLIALFSIAENRLDVVALSGYYSETIVGYYSAGVVVESAMMIFPEGIRNAIFPVFSRLSITDPKKATDIYQLLLKFILLITLAAAVGGIALAPQILALIYKVDFVKSVPIFRILMLSFPFFSFAVLSIRLLNANDQDKKIAKIYGAVMMLSIVLYLVLIPKYASIGTAFVRLSTTILLAVLCFLEVRKIIHDLRVLPSILRGMGASVIMSFVLMLVDEWNLVLNILLGSLVYIGSLILLKTFTKDEFKLIKNLLKFMKKSSISRII